MYREVQDRHTDIQKIERTLEELAQLFNDVSVFPAFLQHVTHQLAWQMSVLVAQQDEAIDHIGTTAATVHADTEAAYVVC